MARRTREPGSGHLQMSGESLPPADGGRSDDMNRPMNDDFFRTYRNAPPHLVRAGAIYMVTAHIYGLEPVLTTSIRKRDWIAAFLRSTFIYHWRIHAWVVLDDHYHVIVQAPERTAASLPKLVSSYHNFTARKWNKEDASPGRRVWWNYRDTCVRSEREFRNRLFYLQRNPVKHRLVSQASLYPFNSFGSE
jgi:putative transposase